MNRDRMNKVADAIEYADRFDLNYYAIHAADHSLCSVITPRELYGDCKTIGCVAGWTCAVYSDPPNVGSILCADDYFDKARDLLGLTQLQAIELFTPTPSMRWSKWDVWNMVDPYKATAKQAAKVLREIASGKRKFYCDRKITS